MENIKIHQINASKALEMIANKCTENGITYYLLAGSCLGAIRHKGFIPWDDDIDIGIKNEDYYAFEKVMREFNDQSSFVWIDNDNKKHYQRFYGKILDEDGSPLIDVFRLVRLPIDDRKKKSLWETRKFLYKLLFRKHNRGLAENELIGNYVISKIVSLVLSENSIVRLARWNEKRYLNNCGKDYINLYSVYSFEKEIIYDKWMKCTTTVLFEGKNFTTVNDPDDYLTHLYGDYMKLPPIEERKRNHDIHFEL